MHRRNQSPSTLPRRNLKRSYSENASNVFRAHYAGDILKPNNHRSCWICVWRKLGQRNHVTIVTSSFSKAPFSKCVPSTRKRKASVFIFLRFSERFRKAPFPWRISVNGRPNWLSVDRLNGASVYLVANLHEKHISIHRISRMHNEGMFQHLATPSWLEINIITILTTIKSKANSKHHTSVKTQTSGGKYISMTSWGCPVLNNCMKTAGSVTSSLRWFPTKKVFDPNYAFWVKLNYIEITIEEERKTISTNR